MAATTWDAARIVAVVAVANLVFLSLNATATRRHERRILKETRTQARIEDAYRDFVTLMHRIGSWADFHVSPTLAGTPAPIDDLDISAAVGRLKTFGSDAVMAAAAQWGDLFSEVTAAVVGSDPGLVQRVAEMRTQEREVTELIRGELNA